MNKLLAPNGKPSNLTPEQYKLVRTPEFKAWFGDWENNPSNASKVVDENGEPLVVYHGTKKEFNIFDKEKINSNYPQSIGFHFNYDKESVKISYASPNSISKEIGFIKSVFLNIKNPLIIKSDFGSSNSAEENIDLNRIKLKEKIINSKKTNNILDGIISTGYSYTKSFVVFETEQIKLADGTNTTFDSNNPDIRFNDGGNVSKYTNGGLTKNENNMVIKFTENQIDYLADQVDIMIETYYNDYDDNGILDEQEADYLEYPETICKNRNDLENLKDKIQNRKGSSYTKIEKDILIARIDMTLDAMYSDNEVAGGKRSLISAQKKLQEQGNTNIKFQFRF